MLLVSLSLVLVGASALHPDSLSRSQVRVEGTRAVVQLRFQALSLLEVHPGFDASGDRILDAGELEAARADIARYLLDSYRLLAGEGEVLLTGDLVALTPEDPTRLGPFELQSIEATLAFEAREPIEVLVVECRLFREPNPWHKDTCFLTWNGESEVPHLFDGREARWLFEPARVRRPGVFALFLGLGFDHIRSGYDHQAFLLALLVASRRLRSLVGVVTAFTVAHSVTLAAASLGWVQVPPRFVELAIALSIAYVACDNLMRRAPRNPWFEAFAFGLLHGLGFAGFLAEALAGERLVVTALFGFNLGVELGQLALVLLVMGVVALLFGAHRRRRKADPEQGLVPGPTRTLVSVCVALAGFYWFVERAGWLPWS